MENKKDENILKDLHDVTTPEQRAEVTKILSETKKYTVTIEQPCIISFEIEAGDIDEAMEIAKEKYETVDKEQLEFGTDAQIMAEAEDGTDSTEWTNL